METPEHRASTFVDASLTPFIQPSFDPATYLNSALPPIYLSSTPVSHRQPGSATLSDLSAHTNQLLSQLNAQASRLTNVLTQLTDEILRSGGRLAYEVEVLRGETTGLSETLDETLRNDVSLFVPGGLSTAKTTDETASIPPAERTHPAVPDYITSLRTLSTVRARLATVVTLFGEAMRWTLPSTDTTSIGNAFISVSAPAPGSTDGSASSNAQQDAKARDFAATLRREIGVLVVGNPGGLRAGYEEALRRIEALRDLARVWRGTAEERPRVRFVEGLARLAEERLAEAEREVEGGRFEGVGRRGSQIGGKVQVEKGVGFLDNLYRLRDAGVG